MGIPQPKVRQRSVDTPVIVRDVSPDANGNVIPQGSRKYVSGNGQKIPGDN